VEEPTNILPTFFSHLENSLIYQLLFLGTIEDALIYVVAVVKNLSTRLAAV
jgi:hypothetical protein